uniref:Uncharacterized protein n=1 Tax=Trichogramma kaykai TaxID=54128 RepID=A0ABD2XIK6_9HYME
MIHADVRVHRQATTMSKFWPIRASDDCYCRARIENRLFIIMDLTPRNNASSIVASRLLDAAAAASAGLSVYHQTPGKQTHASSSSSRHISATRHKVYIGQSSPTSRQRDIFSERRLCTIRVSLIAEQAPEEFRSKPNFSFHCSSLL